MRDDRKRLDIWFSNDFILNKVVMSILLEHELSTLKKELEKIKCLIGKEDSERLLSRIRKILNRLEESKQARIRRAHLEIVS